MGTGGLACDDLNVLRRPHHRDDSHTNKGEEEGVETDHEGCHLHPPPDDSASVCERTRRRESTNQQASNQLKERGNEPGQYEERKPPAEPAKQQTRKNRAYDGHWIFFEVKPRNEETKDTQTELP